MEKFLTVEIRLSKSHFAANTKSAALLDNELVL